VTLRWAGIARQNSLNEKSLPVANALREKLRSGISNKAGGELASVGTSQSEIALGSVQLRNLADILGY
jgi:hypothetical protein